MDRPSVGVATIVVKNGKVLFQKRKNSAGNGKWSVGGGHLEMFETLEECAKREAEEEYGIKIRKISIVTFTNDVLKDEGKHYVTFYAVCETDDEPRLIEPEKTEELEWFSWENLPSPLWKPIENLLEQGFNPLNTL